MDNLGCIEKVFSIISNLFICTGVIVAIWGVIVAKRQLRSMEDGFKADHERRKKQATFEFYHNIYKDFIDQLNKIDEMFPNDSVIDINKAKKNKEIFNGIKNYLSHMERFAVGIKTEIYDIDVFKRMVGATLTKKWVNKFQGIIDDSCKVNPVAYKDLKKLVNELEEDSPKQITDLKS